MRDYPIVQRREIVLSEMESIKMQLKIISIMKFDKYFMKVIRSWYDELYVMYVQPCKKLKENK